jgi:HPt (histidine-containing phosphotransfer) domain-containing protein
MNDTPDFDPQTLVRLRQLGGDSLIRKLVAVFGEYTHDRVMDAVASGLSGDHATLARAAHAVKSSAGNVGALRLLGVASALEQAARAGDTAAIAALVSDLHTAFVAAREYLATALREAA